MNQCFEQEFKSSPSIELRLPFSKGKKKLTNEVFMNGIQNEAF